MFNPYVLIGVLVTWLASLGAVYVKATNDQHARDIAASAKVLEQKLAAAETDWATNYQAALELEQEKQANERKRLSHSHAVAVAVAADPKARDCGLSADSLGVLIGSIRAANGAQDAAPGGGNGGVQPGDGTAGRNPGGSVVRAGQHGVDALGVPPGVQGTAGLGQSNVE